MHRSTSWQYLVQAYQVCTQKYTKLLQQYDLTPSQLDILIQIELLGKEAKPKSVADGLLVSKGNITSVTKRLIERKLIAQQPDKHDKRSTSFHITSEGEALLQEAKHAAKAFINAQLLPFSDTEVEMVGSLMLKMRQHLESEDFDNATSSIILAKQQG